MLVNDIVKMWTPVHEPKLEISSHTIFKFVNFDFILYEGIVADILLNS